MWFITCKKSVKFLYLFASRKKPVQKQSEKNYTLSESKANMDSQSSLGILRLWLVRARFLSADFCIFQAVGDPSSQLRSVTYVYMFIYV